MAAALFLLQDVDLSLEVVVRLNLSGVADYHTATDFVFVDTTEEQTNVIATVLAMFTGHGFETKDGEAAFASEDVELRENGVLKAETAISASALAKGLQKDDAKFKIFIVDACRTPASVDGKLGMFVAPPSFARLDKTGLAFAQSCNVGETSYETTELGGGVFTHFFVEGLNGKAREADGRVTFWGVAGYAAEKTGEYVAKLVEADKNTEKSKRIFTTPQTPSYTMIGYRNFNLRAPTSELLYREGRALAWGLDGRKIDAVRALELLTEADAAGSMDAQAELALLYYRGCAAVAPDAERAFGLASEPAEAGNPFALYVLGDCYNSGRGVDRDEEKAEALYKAAADELKKRADEGDALALDYCGEMYACGDGVEIDFRKAFEFFRKASDLNCALGKANLATCWMNGWGVAVDYAEAVRLLQEARDQNHAAALKGLGDCYMLGWDVEQNYDEAFRAFEAAAAQNYPEAVEMLGYCRQKGLGCEQDSAEAVRLFQRSADWGNPSAKRNLALCYLDGEGCERDAIGALKLLEAAAEQNYSNALKKRRSTYGNAPRSPEPRTECNV